MFLLGHLGIGLKLVEPVSKGLPFRYILFGTIFPDLLDKTIYYSIVWATGLHGAEIGLISGTRTFGHTALFSICCAVVAFVYKSKPCSAFVLGLFTHHLLDSVTEYFVKGTHSDMLQAFLWPLNGVQFPVFPYQNLGEHLSSGGHPFILGAEVVGFMILLPITLHKVRKAFKNSNV